jgi:hypothetical protein
MAVERWDERYAAREYVWQVTPTSGATAWSSSPSARCSQGVERETGFEPATSSLEG